MIDLEVEILSRILPRKKVIIFERYNCCFSVNILASLKLKHFKEIIT